MVVYLGTKPVGVNKVVEKKVAKVKYGVTIDNLLGDVDENGAYTQITKTFEFDATKIKTVNILPEQDTYSTIYLFPYLFCGNKNLVGTIDLSNFSGWTSVKKKPITYLFEQTFSGTGIKKVILPTLLNQATKTAYLYYSFAECDLDLVIFPTGMYTERPADQQLILQNTFEYSTIREIQGLENIESLAKSELNYTFYNATLPEELRFDSLTTISETSFYRTFANAKGLKRLYFSAKFVNVNPKGFGNSTSSFMFRQNSVVEEIHFRADMQSTIESMDGYADKWGATNATIYFSL